MDPSLSIVIPTIGRTVLDKTIASVFEQSVMPDEIIVWDNSGTGAAKQNSEYASCSSIKWKSANERKSIIDSWNTAVGYCSCTFVYILGDDDILLPDFVKTCKKLLAEGSRLIHVENQFINADGTILNSNDSPKRICKMTYPEFLKLYSVSNELNIFLGSLVFPLESFQKIGGFKNIIHNGLAMDVLFNIEMLHQIKNITVVSSPLWQYRILVSGWCGAVKNPDDIPKIASEYLEYRKKVSVFFANEPAVVFRNFNRRRVTSQIVGVCYQASPWKTFLLICSSLFSFREKLTMMRDIFYMVRHQHFKS